MAGEGAVKWMFDKKGSLLVDAEDKPKEELELVAIEAGADDVRFSGKTLEIYTKPEDWEKVKKALKEKGLKIESANLGWVAKKEVVIEEKEQEKAEKLFEELSENDGVQNIYSNLKN